MVMLPISHNSTGHYAYPSPLQRTQVRQPLSTRHLAVIATLLLVQTASAADDVQVWIRAFIPDAVAVGTTVPVVSTSGGAALKASDGGCIATDQRTWSDERGARARLVSDFHLLVDGVSGVQLQSSGKPVTVAAGIRSVDCGSGVEIAVLPAQLLADEVGIPAQTDRGAQISVLAAVADPLRPWSSATIHYDATFIYHPSSRTLEYQALTGFFPAYEAYAALNGGPAVTVFRSGPVRRSESAAGGSKADVASVELKGEVNLGDAGKRPKPPTNLTVQ